MQTLLACNGTNSAKPSLIPIQEPPFSKDRLKRLCGGDLTVFKGKKVLEVGCGSGRFTEIMLKEDATVFAVDLSSAVEANMKIAKSFQTIQSARPMYTNCLSVQNPLIS
jgi:2-polyprenyl-3-methyl-5-hydroxy-6-metoxy-1,4-benzoquinol methylase